MRPLELFELYRTAIAARDWPAVEQLVAEDVVVVDHRPFGFGSLHGRAAWIRYLQGIIALAADTLPEITRVLHEGERDFSVEVAVRGDAEGSSFEITYAVVGRVEEDRMIRAAFYELGDPRANAQPE
jgi:ketosteroid isomerase-like protein